MRSLLAVLGLCACGPAEPTGPRMVLAATGIALTCPPLEPQGAGYAPWETWRRRDDCVSGRAGRWTVTRDTTDADGWRHFLRFEGAGGRGWELTVTSPTGLAVRGDGSLVLLDLKDRVTLISPTGTILAKGRLPDCGAVAQIAVAWDETVTFSCGYSLLRLDRDGKLLWQKWPFGDHHVGGPWVDPEGTLYVSGDGRLAALAPDGTPRWQLETGWNRHVGDLGWLPDGRIAFVTSQAESHTPTSEDGVRIYYNHEPPELFLVTRAGAIDQRVTWANGEAPPGGWPPVVARPLDGAHRVPTP